MGEYIAVVLPTRGYVFFQTLENLLYELLGRSWTLIGSDDKPIPDCFNRAVESALNSTSASYIWFIEEDVVVPEGGLAGLFDLRTDVAFIDYPVSNGYGCAAFVRDTPVLFGTGCTLIKRHVFEKMKAPWFRTDVTYVKRSDTELQRRIGVPTSYGGHDIHFSIEVARHKFSVGVVEGIECAHLRLEDTGGRSENSSVHKIRQVSPISHNRVYSDLRIVDLDNHETVEL